MRSFDYRQSRFHYRPRQRLQAAPKPVEAKAKPSASPTKPPRELALTPLMPVWEQAA